VLSKSALELERGKSGTLTATVQPSNATNKSVAWKSSNTAVATVSNGTVTAVGAGTATITATTADGSYTATCVVTVTESAVAVTGVSLSKTTLELEKGKSGTLTATVQPSNATDKSVTWKSSNAAVATVSNDTVTAVGAGTAAITATTADGGYTATCTVTVKETEGEDSFRFVMSKGKGAAGDTVEVTIFMENNPGIIAACMSVAYDADKLTLLEVKDTGLLNDSTFSKNTQVNPYLMRWEDSLATVNNTKNGAIVTLKFQIAEDCPEGMIPLALILSEGEIYDTDLSKVSASAVNGGIEVVRYISGDANGDAIVNSMDVTLLRRFLAGWENVRINKEAMDVNDDEDVTSLDVTILRRYLAGWENVSLLFLNENPELMCATLSQTDPLCFTVSDVEGRAGEEVTVTVSLENNPGIVAACMSLSYDSSKLELLNMKDSGLLNDGTFSQTTDANPYAMRWEDSLAEVNNTDEGVIATLTFRILEDCQPGTSDLTLNFRAGEVYDVDLDAIPFEVENGTVTITGANSDAEMVSYDPDSGIVSMNYLPEGTAVVLAAAYEDGRMLSCGSGSEEVILEDAESADMIRVFCLDVNYRPVSEAVLLPSVKWN